MMYVFIAIIALYSSSNLFGSISDASLELSTNNDTQSWNTIRTFNQKKRSNKFRESLTMKNHIITEYYKIGPFSCQSRFECKGGPFSIMKNIHFLRTIQNKLCIINDIFFKERWPNEKEENRIYLLKMQNELENTFEISWKKFQTNLKRSASLSDFEF